MKIILHRKFEKRFAKLSRKIQEKFKERRDLFLENPSDPTLNNHPLGGDREGQWSINITGDWRAIYTKRRDDTTIFLDIDTHSNLYK